LTPSSSSIEKIVLRQGEIGGAQLRPQQFRQFLLHCGFFGDPFALAGGFQPVHHGKGLLGAEVAFHQAVGQIVEKIVLGAAADEQRLQPFGEAQFSHRYHPYILSIRAGRTARSPEVRR
jgi:hypothetical protein